jgi:hypothetical protein
MSVRGTLASRPQATEEEAEMFVRAARFEGIDPARVERDYEQFREMVRATEAPEGLPEDVFETLRGNVRRVMSFLDREEGTSLDLTFTDDAEGAQRVHEALDKLSPPEGAGRRTDFKIYEVLLDEQL